MFALCTKKCVITFLKMHAPKLLATGFLYSAPDLPAGIKERGRKGWKYKGRKGRERKRGMRR